MDNPDVIDASDIILADIYPFYQGISISNAVCELSASYQQLVHKGGGKQVIIAETGWPDAGEPIGLAIPSLANADRYFSEFTSWARAGQIPFFYFEAFDEPWKSKTDSRGGHFGIWNSDTSL